MEPGREIGRAFDPLYCNVWRGVLLRICSIYDRICIPLRRIGPSEKPNMFLLEMATGGIVVECLGAVTD